VRRADQELLDLFKISDGRVVTTKQVAIFVGACPATRTGLKDAAHAVRRLRDVLPAGCRIETIRDVGYVFKQEGIQS